jgi:type IV pilus assembly protein PilM
LFTASAIWGLDIGDSSIKAIKLRKSGSDVVVEDFDRVTLNPTTKKNEGYIAVVQEAVEKMAKRKDFSKCEVCVTISAKNANSRFITMDSDLKPKQFAEEIREEAERQIPFPLDEVEWGYHRMGDLDEGEQVALFAVRTEHVNQLVEVLSASGLNVKGVQVPGVALYNFITYMTDIDEHLVLLDFGEKSTDVILIHDGQFWLRSLPLSGQHITSLLEKKFRITTQEANRLKHEMEKSPQRDRLFRVIEPKLKELVIEIKRSINFRRTQVPDLAPKTFLAWGGSSQLKGVESYFVKNLSLKKFKLDLEAIDWSKMKKAKAIQSNIASFGVAFGLAIQGLGYAEADVNLIPKGIVRDQFVKTRKWSLLIANVFLLILMFVWGKAHVSVLDKVKEVKAKVGQASSQHQKSINEFKGKMAEFAPEEKKLRTIIEYQRGDMVIPEVYRAVVETADQFPTVSIIGVKLNPLRAEHFLLKPPSEVTRAGSEGPEGEFEGFEEFGFDPAFLEGMQENAESPDLVLQVDFVSKNPIDNSSFMKKLTTHPFFNVPGMDPILEGGQKDYKWSFNPRVELDGGDVFQGSSEIQKMRFDKGWLFDLQGESKVQLEKVAYQSLKIKLMMPKVMGIAAAETKKDEGERE